MKTEMEKARRDFGTSSYLIEFDDVWHVVLLFQLLLPLQQRVHAVVTAADLLVVLLLQHGGDTAQAADAAPPGAHPAGAAPCCRRLGVTGASRHAQGLPSPADELLCENIAGPPFIHTLMRVMISNNQKTLVSLKAIRTGQRQGDEVHAPPTHDGATESTVVPSVPDVEFVSTIRAKRDI